MVLYTSLSGLSPTSSELSVQDIEKSMPCHRTYADQEFILSDIRHINKDRDMAPAPGVHILRMVGTKKV